MSKRSVILPAFGGVCIALFAGVSAMLDHQYLSPLIFSVGILLIIHFGLSLITRDCPLGLPAGSVAVTLAEYFTAPPTATKDALELWQFCVEGSYVYFCASFCEGADADETLANFRAWMADQGSNVLLVALASARTNSQTGELVQAALAMRTHKGITLVQAGGYARVTYCADPTAYINSRLGG